MDQCEKQYEGSAAGRIMDAIIGAIALPSLEKLACTECREMICRKDMPKHMSQHIEIFEMVGQSERESYQIAHS